MNVFQTILLPSGAWRDVVGSLESRPVDLVLAFGPRQLLEGPGTLEAIRQRFPGSHHLLVSTAGNLAGTQIEDEGVVCTGLQLERSSIRCVAEYYPPDSDLRELCKGLMEKLIAPGLRHVLVFSDGRFVNGSVLSESFNTGLPRGVTVSGGLAGDGNAFLRTAVGLDAVAAPGGIAAVGFYGDALRVGFGNAGGWSSFGPTRVVTESRGNVLLTLDGLPALEVYRNYLGDEASGLPAAALRFPLCVNASGQTGSVVRTILSIDEGAGSMTFAGDIPHGASVRFMRASYEDLITGAEDAASQAVQNASLVLCVSCVGRRIVLGQRTEEELEGVRASFGPAPVLAGFYSYGELAPSGESQACLFHNQTMTITSMAEVDTATGEA